MNLKEKLQGLKRAGWREFVLLFVVAMLSVSVWVFIEVADEVMEGERQPMEERVLLAFRRADDLSRPIGPQWLADVSRDITSLGSFAVLTLMTLLVIGHELFMGRRGAALLVGVAALGGLGLSTLLKNWFDRERPSVVPHLTDVLTASFPSGHSMLSSVVYLTLGALLARTVPRRAVKIYFILAAVLLCFLIGLSRVHLGVHYPSDVLAGWSAGTAWALVCWLVAYWLQARGAVESGNRREADG